jgi:hypothetical protein
MKSQNYALTRYDADEGKLFDWKEPRYTEDENGEQIQEHLMVKTLFIGGTDSILNYVEVDANGVITELEEPEMPNINELTEKAKAYDILMGVES